MKLKKQLTKALSLLFIVILIVNSTIFSVFANEISLEDEKDKEVQREKIIDNDEVTVYAESNETEEAIRWEIAFEKKPDNEKAGRIRLALDIEALTEAAISDISGIGLQQENDTLITEDYDDRPWFVGEDYATEQIKGSLSFSIDKNLTEQWKKVPLDVSVDFYKVIQTAPAGFDLNNAEIQERLNQVEMIRSEQNESSLRLGPGAFSDPYAYLPNGTQQNRYPVQTTNDYIKRTGSGYYPYSSSVYSGLKGSAYSGNTLINDSNYKIGGANWRNFDYKANYSPSAGQASTIQLWGANRNFDNSYLNYNGAFTKKWIEPIASNGTQEDNTIDYNVYLDVIGGSIPLRKKLDVVLVLDKSNSMTVAGSDGIVRDTALRNSVTNLVNSMFSNPALDLRMGMVNFYSESSGGSQDPKNREYIRSNDNRAGLTADRNQLLNATTNPALFDTPRGGTPTALGLRKGYEMLYWDGNDREKILILISDGCPTFHYEGVQNSNGSDYNGVGYYSYDSGNTMFRNYESNYTGRDPNGNAAQSNFAANLKYPTNFTRPGGNFIRGEVQDMDNKTTHWAGYGGQNFFNASIRPGAYNTVAYQRWLNDMKNGGRYRNTNVFTLGIGINPGYGNTDYVKVQNAIGTNVLKNIADKKSDGTPQYYDTNTQRELINALQEIGNSVSDKTLKNARIIDNVGDNVTVKGSPSVEYYYVPVNSVNSPPYQQPTVWNTSQHGPYPTVSLGQNGKQIAASNITLGTSEMIRIKYQVQLTKHDGKFYTETNQAYLNAPSLSGNMYFPSPSLRYLEEPEKQLQLELQKNDTAYQPIAGVRFELRQSNTVVATGTSDDQGRVKFKRSNNSDFFLEVGEYQLHETSVPSGIELPSNYWIIQYLADGSVRYRSSTSGSWIYLGKTSVSSTLEMVEITILNQRIEEPEKLLQLEIDKRDSSNQPLSGVGFELRQSNNVVARGTSDNTGRVKFKTSNNSDFYLGVGEYQLYEVSVPNGFVKPNNYWIIQHLADGSVRYRSSTSPTWIKLTKKSVNEWLELVDFTIINQREEEPDKLLGLELEKVDKNNRPVKDVEFELRQSNRVIALGSSDENGRVKFKKPDNSDFYLEVGEYQLYETSVPEGFVRPTSHWVIQYLPNGAVQYRESSSGNWVTLTKKPVNANLEIVSFTIINHREEEPSKDLQLELQKVDADVKPIEGVKFEIHQNNTLVARGTSDSNGRVKFKRPNDTDFLLEVGEYLLYETSVPNGIAQPTNHWIIQHLEDGIVRYRSGVTTVWTQLTRKAINEHLEMVEFTITNQRSGQESDEELSIYKTDEKGVPINGVVFSDQIFRGGSSTTYYAITGDVNDPLNPAPGVGNFYELIRIDPVTQEYILDYTRPIPKKADGQVHVLLERKNPLGYFGSTEMVVLVVDSNLRWCNNSYVPYPEGVPWKSNDGKITVMITNGRLKATYVNDRFPIDLNVRKKDDNGNSLQGATFEMYHEVSGSWEPYAPGLTAVPTGGSEFSSANLQPGRYKIIEHTAPAGYQLLPGYILLEVKQQSNGSIKANAYHYPEPDSAPNSFEDLGASVNVGVNKITISFDVNNRKFAAPLPNTGGIGRRIYFFIAIGIFFSLLIPGAILFLRSRPREEH